MVSRYTRGTADPEPVRYTVTANHRVQITNPTLTTGVFQVTGSTIAAALPGTGAAWQTFRIKKISAWGTDANTTSPTIPLGLLMNTVDRDGGALGDQAEFHDYGTAGSMRPQIHVLPSFAVRQYWFNSSNGNIMAFSSSTTAPPGSIIVNLSLELESVPFSSSPSFQGLRDELRLDLERLSVSQDVAADA